MSFPHCLSTVIIYFKFLVVLLKVRQSTQIKTMISQYITTPLINEQEKLQQKKIKESVFQLVVFFDDSVRHLKKKEIWSFSSSFFIMSPLPYNPLVCALNLQYLWSEAQLRGWKHYTTACDVSVWQQTLKERRGAAALTDSSAASPFRVMTSISRKAHNALQWLDETYVLLFWVTGTWTPFCPVANLYFSFASALSFASKYQTVMA